MVQQNPQNNPPRQRSALLNLRELVPGDKVRLSGDIIVEVVENPKDGMWFRGKYLTVPGSPAAEGTEDQIFAADVQEQVF